MFDLCSLDLCSYKEGLHKTRSLVSGSENWAWKRLEQPERTLENFPNLKCCHYCSFHQCCFVLCMALESTWTLCPLDVPTCENFLKKFLLLFSYSYVPFLPTPPPHPSRTPLPPPLSPSPLDLVHVSFIVVPVIPSPHWGHLFCP